MSRNAGECPVWLKRLIQRVSPIVVVLACVGAFRFSLVGRGAMAFLDETMYYNAALALEKLRTGHVVEAIAHVASNNGRPGNAMLQMVPAAVQAIPFAFGVSPSNPRALVIPVAANAALSLVTLYLFWRISLCLFRGDRVASTVAAVMFGLLVNANLYVRHLLACEPALCVGMLGLWVAVSRPPTRAVAITVGLLAGFTVTVYPGYYLFAVITGFALVGVVPRAGSANRAARVAAWALGGAMVVLGMEALCRIGGVSYVASLRTLSDTISQGSFDEGWVFVPRYLIQVERYAGVVLLCGLAAWAGQLLWDLKEGPGVRMVHWLILPATMGWVYQAVASSHLHSTVLYGRLIHAWMPLMVWATIDVASRLRRTTWKAIAYATVLVASVVSWTAYAPGYVGLSYPIDVLYSLGINTTLLPATQRHCEMVPSYAYISGGPLDRQTGFPYSKRNDYSLVNFCMGRPLSSRSTPDPALARQVLLYQGAHFLTFRAYGFEGFTAEERDEVSQPGAYDLRVYAPGP